ncbi:MAG: polyprenol monophosphomannose synthase [Anaerolineaceae bacterium]
MSTFIVIPTYNELENLPILSERLFQLPISDLKLLVVDDNSPDGTGKLADSLAASNPDKVFVLHRAGKLGLGTAYVSGFKRALELGAERVVQMDADFSHPPEKLVEFMQAIQDADLVIGSRYVPGGSVDRDWAFTRKLLSSFGNFYARTLLNGRIHDMTGGFRMWRREVLERMPLDSVKSNGYMFQVEMAYIAQLMNLRVKEIPIYFAERKFGKSKIDFSIQMEAAISVWKLPGRYRKLRKS